MQKIVLLLITVLSILLAAVWAEAAGTKIKLFVNQQEIKLNTGAILQDGRVLVPLRFVAEAFNAKVVWDNQSKSVAIEEKNLGDAYLKGQMAKEPGISNNLIKPAALKAILDDDKDNHLTDYREGHDGGDNIANDPLVIDVRSYDSYSEAHIPGAIWIDSAGNMAEGGNVAKLKALLAEHVRKGGLESIVLCCYTGNTSGLVAGVLGAQGLPVKNLMNGFDVGWRGTKTIDKPIEASMETLAGETIYCGG